MEARLQLHHAAQLVAAMGKYLIPTRPDDSHTALKWSSEYQALVGEAVSADHPVHGAIRPRDLTFLLIDNFADTVSELPLDAAKMDDALAWLNEQLTEKGIDTAGLSLKMHYEIPEHPVANGQPFNVTSREALMELARLYGNLDLLLQQIAADHPNASPVTCWPHHFDLATLITVEANDDPEKAKTIGVGLSPGDGGYPMPYLYITPWPYPDSTEIDLPELPAGGFWHTRDWFGGVLTADKIETGPDASDQAQQLIDFISAAITESRKFL